MKPPKFWEDVIISIGYRVNSTRATQFRIRATNILKRYLIDGYTLNEKRLREQTLKLQALQRAVKLIGSMKDRKQQDGFFKRYRSFGHWYALSFRIAEGYC